jgi:hypothetical protein
MATQIIHKTSENASKSATPTTSATALTAETSNSKLQKGLEMTPVINKIHLFRFSKII